MRSTNPMPERIRAARWHAIRSRPFRRTGSGQRSGRHPADQGRSGGRPGMETSRPLRTSLPSRWGSEASSASVWGAGPIEEVEGGPCSTAWPAYDEDVIGGFGDDAHVVRDHHHRHVELRAELVQEIENTCLDGDVERRRGLVGDQELRVAGDRHRNHHALSHSTRESVRVVRQPPRRIGDANVLEQLDCPLARVVGREVEVAP